MELDDGRICSRRWRPAALFMADHNAPYALPANLLQTISLASDSTLVAQAPLTRSSESRPFLRMPTMPTPARSPSRSSSLKTPPSVAVIAANRRACVEDPTMTIVHAETGNHSAGQSSTGKPITAPAYNQRVRQPGLGYAHDLDPAESSLMSCTGDSELICYGRYLRSRERARWQQRARQRWPRVGSSAFFPQATRRPQEFYLSVIAPCMARSTPRRYRFPTRVAWTATGAEQARVPVNPPGALCVFSCERG